MDSEVSAKVETHITELLGRKDSHLKAIVWITHSGDQAARVGNRFFHIADGSVQESEHVIHNGSSDIV